MPAQAPRAQQGPAPGLAPVTLIVGEEELLVERAVAAARAAVIADDPGPDPDVHDVVAANLAHGELSMLTSPSLFGGLCVVIVRAAHDATSAVAAELTQ